MQLDIVDPIDRRRVVLRYDPECRIIYVDVRYYDYVQRKNLHAIRKIDLDRLDQQIRSSPNRPLVAEVLMGDSSIG